MLLELLALIVGVGFCIVSNVGIKGFGSISAYMDLPTLLLISILILPSLLLRGTWRDCVRGVKLLRKDFSCSLNEMKKAQCAVEFLQKHLLWAGVIITLTGIINLFMSVLNASDASRFQVLGPSLAVVSLGPLYIALLEFLLLPLETVVKKRILEYMEDE